MIIGHSEQMKIVPIAAGFAAAPRAGSPRPALPR